MFNARSTLGALAISAIALAGLAAAACGDDDDKATATTAPRTSAAATTAASSATGQTAKVQIADNSFTPSVKVKAGGKVTWDWSGSSNPHSVVGTSDNAKTLLKSEQNSGGKGSYEVTFATAGTYKYQCGVHGAAMTGEVVVE